MKSMNYSWVFCILLTLVLNSCGSSYVTTNHGIQKRKYTKGLFVMHHGSISSKIKETAKPTETVEFANESSQSIVPEKVIKSSAVKSKGAKESIFEAFSPAQLASGFKQVLSKSKDRVIVASTFQTNTRESVPFTKEPSMQTNQEVTPNDHFEVKKEVNKSDKRLRRFIMFLTLSIFLIILLAAIEWANPEFLILLLIIAIALTIVNAIALVANKQKARKSA